MRNCKGRLQHVVVVTGDVDCVYHFALPELIESLEQLTMEDHTDMLQAMVQGKRLKDIPDLPLDPAV